VVLGRLEQKMGLPSLRDVMKLLSGEGGKRVESILNKLDKLSDDKEVLVEATRLMEVIHEMGKNGELDKLDSVLRSLPKGKAGASLIMQVRELLTGLDSKIERLSDLASTIMSKGD
jgi:hypothetical protein